MDFGKYTHVVWDFNGTILDDVGIGIESVNCLLERRGLPLVESVEAYRDVFGFPIENYYRRLGFDFDKEPYGVIAVEWVNEYNKRRPDAGLCDGARELLELVREKGIPQLVISATEINMLESQLRELGVAEYFDEFTGLDNIKAGSKRHLAVNWREAHPEAKVIFIGDTDHDLEVSKAMGAECVLVAAGHQSRAHLEGLGENVTVVGSLRELF